ncbi:DUF4843 domain-containing protein [Alistipes sp. OttesenSCG-928-B03]|nr:DUF4843 domain-containing protein [Alistipes sp. OttesenSCG-928-B03]
MKKIYVALMLLPLLGIAFASCKEDRLLTFDREDNVYFSLQKWNITSKGSGTQVKLEFDYDGKTHVYRWLGITKPVEMISKTMHFKPDEVKSEIIFVPVSLLGKPSPVKREIGWRLNPQTTTADDRHFKVLDAYIPANATMGAIVVEIYRDGLSGTTEYVGLELEPNQNFATNYKTIPVSKATDAPLTSMIGFTLEISDEIVRPVQWDAAWEIYYFGSYSAKKMELILSLTDADPALFYPDKPDTLAEPARIGACAAVFRSHIDMMRQLGTPVLEADGTEMTYSIE